MDIMHVIYLLVKNSSVHLNDGQAKFMIIKKRQHYRGLSSYNIIYGSLTNRYNHLLTLESHEIPLFLLTKIPSEGYINFY